MFKPIICLMLVGILLLSTTPVFAARPIADSVQSLVQASAQQTTRRTVDTTDGAAFFWSGLTMLGAGATLEILSYTALKNQSAACVFGYYGDYACASETSTNKPVLITGLVVATIGGVMTDIGWKNMHPMITFGPRPTVGVRVRF